MSKMRLLFTNDWLRRKLAADPDDDPQAGSLFGEFPMSYAFSITATSKEEATGKIREQFDAVVAAQPTHAADKEGAIAAAQTLVRLWADPLEGEEIVVHVSGSLGWNFGFGAPKTEFTSVDLSIKTFVHEITTNS